MKPIATIKANDLVSIATAAELWFKKMNEINQMFELEHRAAKELRDILWKTNWDEDAYFNIKEGD